METINSMATAARNSVFGESNNNTPIKKPETPAEPAITQSRNEEPPAGDLPGKGTPDSPFDPGNTPEQVEANASTPVETGDAQPHTVAAITSAPTAAPTADMDSKDTDSQTKPGPKSAAKTRYGNAKPGSHSALFGLGSDSCGGTKSTTSPPLPDQESTGTGGMEGTIKEVEEDKEVVRQAEKDKVEVTEQAKKREEEEREKEEVEREEDEACGYNGFKKAAIEEEEKKKTGNGTHLAPFESRSADEIAEAEGRDPRSMQKKNSYGRDISPGEMPDGTHRKSIAEAPSSSHHPGGHLFTRRTTHGVDGSEKGNGASAGMNGGGAGGGFRDKLKDKFRSKK